MWCTYGNDVSELSRANDVILSDDIILAGENPGKSLKEAEEALTEAEESLREAKENL